MSLRRRGLRALVLGGLAALTVVAFGASSAWAEPSTYCVKATKVLTPKKHFTGGFNDKGCTSVNGTHEGKFEKLASFTAPEEAQLKALLKYMTVQAKGVGGKPTVQFSGANVQVVNGEGNTATKNGAGNLVIGYDENPENFAQTGSHDLILGEKQTFTSYGGILGGLESTLSGSWSAVLAGYANAAIGEDSSVSGGVGNSAEGFQASVSGGEENRAIGGNTSISGGYKNTANTTLSSISGGEQNTASSGGAWIGGGFKNEVFSKGTLGEDGERASIFGGKENKTAKDYEAIP